MRVDLHCHSTASDGVLAPAALVQRAHEKGVGLLALTDHDTLEGLPEAHQAAARLGIELVNGVELSCTWGGATIHVLGYGFDLDAAPLRQATEALHRGRWARAEEIDRRLAAKGMPGALEGARAIQRALGDSGNAPARPHFAEFLVRGGWVKDRADAFRKWLGAGKLGDVKQHWPTLEEVVGCLREARAWISLAHPYHYDFTRTKRRRLVADFLQAGGHAIEVVNGVQPAEQVGTLSILAREFGLMVTAGSDFHAPGDWSELGMYRAVPEDLPAMWPRFARHFRDTERHSEAKGPNEPVLPDPSGKSPAAAGQAGGGNCPPGWGDRLSHRLVLCPGLPHRRKDRGGSHPPHPPTGRQAQLHPGLPRPFRAGRLCQGRHRPVPPAQGAHPGPYTFILSATREVPRMLLHPKRRTIGLRVPNCPIARALLEELGEPLMSVSLIMPGSGEPLNDPYEMRQVLEHQVDLIVDGGYGGGEASTVISLTDTDPEVIRVGCGDPAPFMQPA